MLFTHPTSSDKSSDKLIDLPMVDTGHDHGFMASATNNNILSFSATNPAPVSRKALHRDIERKRRQEMSGLYASLRALLPLERIKGKRSVCDHMQEAVNHIDSMHKKIQELRARRDKLRKTCNGATNSGTAGSLGNRVVLNPAHHGVEILISCSVKCDSELGLSRLLAELPRGELSVLSCVSTRTKESLLHQIQAEATVDMSSLDLSGLQQRLTNIINQ